MLERLLVFVVLLITTLPAFGADNDDVALRKYHPWGRFHVGSWNQVRVSTETIDAQGHVSSVSVSNTIATLMERGSETYSLKIESTVEVAGKRIASPPINVKLGYAGESAGEQLTFRDIAAMPLSIEGRQISCSAQEVEVVSGGQRQITLVHYADAVAPFVLHRKTTQTDLTNKTQTQETEFDVVALEMPFKVCGELRNTAYTKQVQRNARGVTITFSVVSPDVPGELVQQTSKKLDDAGKVTHRSTLELVSYSAASAPPRGQEPETRIPRRYHKKRR